MLRDLAAFLGGPIRWWFGRREKHRAAHERIYNEAFSLKRELAAGLYEPRQDRWGVWAQALQRGFDVLEPRFDRLAELGVDAAPKVKKMIRLERERFLDAAQRINESLVGALTEAEYERIRGARRDLLRCLAGVNRILESTR